MPSLLQAYRTQMVPAMMREFGYASPMQVPRFTKVVLNIGLGEALTNAKATESASRDLSLISGQKAVLTKAKKAIASFKLRKGVAIGAMVTIRGDRMYFFVEKLFNVVLPRVREFRGVSRSSFDGRGNYSLGMREQIVFPEIDYNQIDKIRGLQVTICTTARTDREAQRLLELAGMPFTREQAAAS
ncbi:MAG: 50S ribosomal protein L5 [Chloroflexi bacterium]|nr:50S ribosomal protein L5 [Chloroflexota bacterium]